MAKLKLVLVLLLLLSVSALAEEGMWLLTQLDQLDLQKKGLELKPDDIYNPNKTSITDAIVWLGGCSWWGVELLRFCCLV